MRRSCRALALLACCDEWKRGRWGLTLAMTEHRDSMVAKAFLEKVTEAN